MHRTARRVGHREQHACRDGCCTRLGILAAELHARLEREFGCVNCTIDRGSRECAESGHRHCDALKPDDEQARGEL